MKLAIACNARLAARLCNTYLRSRMKGLQSPVYTLSRWVAVAKNVLSKRISSSNELLGEGSLVVLGLPPISS